jgi:hypothetical protein
MYELEFQEPLMTTPEAALELMLFEKYLRTKGHTTDTIGSLSMEEARQLLCEASSYASCRLAEIEARSKYFHLFGLP